MENKILKYREQILEDIEQILKDKEQILKDREHILKDRDRTNLVKERVHIAPGVPLVTGVNFWGNYCIVGIYMLYLWYKKHNFYSTLTYNFRAEY